jgi:predicted HTH domain antitoxin
MVKIDLSIKENILLSLKQTQEEFKREILFMSALMLYRKRKLSLGKAAELAGYTKISFIERLQQEQKFIFDYTNDEIDEIFADADRIYQSQHFLNAYSSRNINHLEI